MRPKNLSQNHAADVPRQKKPKQLGRLEASSKGEHLDVTSDTTSHSRSRLKERRFLGVRFACCDVYARVYVNQAETAYVGNCPRCAKRIEIGIGAGGSDSRFFTAY